MENSVVEYKTQTGIDIKLTPQVVKRYLVQGRSEMVSDQELMYFMNLCKARKLNPFLKDCFLIKYGKDPASIVTSVDYFRKNARKASDCQGWQKGAVVTDSKGNLRYSKGIVLENERVVGGWFRAKPKGWDEPFEHEVPLNAYIKKTKEGRTTKFWSEEKQSSMIAKVAESQGLKILWGEDSSGMYSADEVPADMESVKVEEFETQTLEELLEGKDIERLDEYIDHIATQGQRPVEDVRVRAMQNIEGFFSRFIDWKSENPVVEANSEPPKPTFRPTWTARNSEERSSLLDTSAYQEMKEIRDEYPELYDEALKSLGKPSTVSGCGQIVNYIKGHDNYASK